MRAKKIEILHEDDEIVIIDKPAGRPVHPSPGHEEGAISTELAASRPQMRRVGSADRAGVVHRLDVETSGVMVFAKTQRAYLALRKAFESHRDVEKTYLAVLCGTPKDRRGTLCTLIGPRSDKKRMRVVEEDGKGELAVTHWNVLGAHNGRSLVEFRIETGRTHQIRVHAAYLGHPIAGDSLYGGENARGRASRLLLHAVELAFTHPATGERVRFVAPPPPEIVYA